MAKNANVEVSSRADGLTSLADAYGFHSATAAGKQECTDAQTEARAAFGVEVAAELERQFKAYANFMLWNEKHGGSRQNGRRLANGIRWEYLKRRVAETGLLDKWDAWDRHLELMAVAYWGHGSDGSDGGYYQKIMQAAIKAKDTQNGGRNATQSA